MRRFTGLILLLILLILPVSSVFAVGVPIEAVKGANVDLSKYEIIHPTELTLTTSEKNLMVSGKAVSGTKVTIKLFGTSDAKKKHYDLNKLPPKEEYILLQEDIQKSGNMEFFQKQLVLVNGVNKIQLTFEDTRIAPVEILVYVSENTANDTVNKEIRISNVKPLLK
ncbi:MAG: hypothetical protein GXZ11_09320 [Tissierellia bacterium]|nr:hypothetical protein [Tissierellia bacterium]